MYSIKEIEANLFKCGSTNKGKPWMLTVSGNTVSFDDPQLDQINLFDICHHLGRINRFTGAIDRESYSVAQHLLLSTVIAKDVLDREESVNRHSVEYFDQLLAVALHDAEEAYVNDLSSPLKRAISPSTYKWIAVNLRQKVYEKFGVDWAYHNELVKLADLNALVIERAIMLPESLAWPKMSKVRMLVTDLPLMSSVESQEHLENLISQLVDARDVAKEAERAAAAGSPTV